MFSREYSRICFRATKSCEGYHVSRRGGWDTHGLPVEIEVEKQLGFTNKQQIEEYGIDKFNELCKKSVFTYIREWERLTERIGFWVDLEDAYVTYTNEYVEFSLVDFEEFLGQRPPLSGIQGCSILFALRNTTFRS